MIVLSVIWIQLPVSAQEITRNIKGIVRDADSHHTLPGAIITVVNSNPLVGSITDNDGNFSIRGLQPGRYDLKITYLGYEPAVLNEILVQSGKEVILLIELTESATALEEVQVRASSNKEHAINPMAMISSRQLNMEEASRYAGGIDDPSRLASSFAGVAGSLATNAIVIRGNAPKGLLWRMEGIEIPNPSHFANVSTFGGGGITALSSQMLGNSDFYTGAFPSEFGNALSGVFDMRIRTGNNIKREHTLKAGIIGLDFATEGPFVKGKKSSYLLNYRYSTLALISPLLPANARGIKYQDFSFKLSFPMGKSGTLSAWALLSGDRTGSEAKKDSAEWQYFQDMEKDRNINRMGAAGINHKILISEKTYLNTALATAGNEIEWRRQRLNDRLQLRDLDEIYQKDLKYTLAFLINHKFSATHTNRTGFNMNLMDFDLHLRHNENDSQSTFVKDKLFTGLFQVYTQSRISLTKLLTLNAGLHSQWFLLNNEITVEPRLSIKWKLPEKQSLSMAYGLHSRIEPLSFYLAREATASGNRPNQKLDLTKAHHFVISYEKSVGSNTRLIIEPYYQWLFEVPVTPESSFSMINLEIDWFFNDSLTNSGSGRNLGVDVTLERFLHKGYYYLITGSLFDAVYKGGDGVTRNTRFNKNLVLNFLFGKEWNLEYKSSIINLSGKFTYLGGDRISPLNHHASDMLREAVYNENKAFTDRKPPVYYLDLSASWRINREKFSSTWSVQFLNLLFQKEFFGHRYNLKTGNVEPLREVIVIPNFSYRIDF